MLSIPPRSSYRTQPPHTAPRRYPKVNSQTSGRTALVAAIIALTLCSTAAADGGYSIKSGGQWYWSTDVADSAFPPGHVDAHTTLYSAKCKGIGASIASPDVNVDLYHRFRCLLSGARFNRLAAFNAAVTTAKDRATKLAAEAKRAQYIAHGDPFTEPALIVVTSRREYDFA